MDKQDIIDRFNKTIAMLKKIPVHKWNYSAWISDYSVENKCGSVCCALGWYPKFIPESGLEWSLDKENVLCLVDKDGDEGIVPIAFQAARWHGVNYSIITVIFASADIYFRLLNHLNDPLEKQEGWNDQWDLFTSQRGSCVEIGYPKSSEAVSTEDVTIMIELFQWLIKNEHIEYRYGNE